MNANLQFTLNGKSQRVSTESRRTLLDVLREDLDLTGTKYGCGEGQCRACTVLLDGKPVRSCLTEIGEIEGKKVETIEGLATDGKLHPVQVAFEEERAMQCGFCTSGMILSAVALLNEKPKPTDAEILAWMNPQICRCCSYPRILKAVQRSAAQPQR